MKGDWKFPPPKKNTPPKQTNKTKQQQQQKHTSVRTFRYPCTSICVHLLMQIMSKVMEMYQPSAVVLQCGADSLSGDRLGCFNLTLKGKYAHKPSKCSQHFHCI